MKMQVELVIEVEVDDDSIRRCQSDSETLELVDIAIDSERVQQYVDERVQAAWEQSIRENVPNAEAYLERHYRRLEVANGVD